MTMADSGKISSMVPADELDGSEYIEVLQDGENRKAQVSELMGVAGPTGDSAYVLAQSNGFTGTLPEYIESLKGEKGDVGSNGLSSYELAVADGFAGTETEYLTSLVGSIDAGINIQGTFAAVEDLPDPLLATEDDAWMIGENVHLLINDEWINVGPIQGPQGISGVKGEDGENGLSSYELAVADGFAGTEVEYQNSLIGPQGDGGDEGPQGPDGLSSYELAANNGFVGSETEYLASLVGVDGVDGSGGEVVRRVVVVTNNGVDANVILNAIGTQANLDSVTVSQSGGNVIELSTVPDGLKIKSVTIAYLANFNATTGFTFKYPEPFGETDAMLMTIPLMFVFNHAVPSVMQSTSMQNYKNVGGIVEAQKTNLLVNSPYRFRYELI